VIDSHVHLSRHYSGGLKNEWQPDQAESFHRDFSEDDYIKSVQKGAFNVKAAVFVECFNRPPVAEAKWVLKMISDPKSVVVGLTAQICAQKGAAAVNEFLDQIRDKRGKLPKGLKGGRFVFMAWENKAPDACLDSAFLEGLAVLDKAGLLWEFAVHPFMAPNLAACCSKFPNMTFVIDHLAHNGNDGGEMEKWGPAIDALAKLPNVYAKMGAVEEWDVPNPGDYMDRTIAAFSFDRILYESNWFVSEAMGDTYDRTASLLKAACERAGATEADLYKVFAGNAIKVYSLSEVMKKKQTAPEPKIRQAPEGAVEMKVTTKKGAGFYVNAACSFLRGVDAKPAEGGKDAVEAKSATNKLRISGLGEAVNVAVVAATRIEALGLGTITSTQTAYPTIQSRGCAQIVIDVKRK